MSYKEAYLYFILTRLPLNLLFTQNPSPLDKSRGFSLFDKGDFFILRDASCKQQIPLDLHVLGTSPAFTLSHDQTLSTNDCSNNNRKILEKSFWY